MERPQSSFTMADEGAQTISVSIKGPSEFKLTVEIALDATVRQLKEKIEGSRGDVPADSQRLIYSGKVLKDEETLQSYKLQNNREFFFCFVCLSLRLFLCCAEGRDGQC